MVFTNSPENFEKAATEGQRHIVEPAYIIPLYTRTIHKALNNEVKDFWVLTQDGQSRIV